ncbi:MAG: hypothetical protein WA655_03880 [Candidatus Korobacteraceae bacterium]
MRRRFSGGVGRRPLFLALVLIFLFASACKTTKDAAAAATQLNTAATKLAAYYDDLSAQLDDTVRLNELQAAFYPIPFTDADRAPILEVKSEIGKRAAMAHSLANLATAYGNLAGSTASADASTAASSLANELQTAKALPQGSAIPDIAGEAAKLLVTFAQTRSLKAGAVGVNNAVGAVSTIFDGEEKAYESIQKQRLALARQIAVKLVDTHDIEINFPDLVEPATKPFSLSPKTPDVGDDPKYLQLVKSGIDDQVQEQERQYADSTESLSASLHAVYGAIERIAKQK